MTDLGFYSDEGYNIGSQYGYDANGNITVYANRVEYEYGANPLVDTLTRIGHSHYHYDTANQLVREDNEWLGKTFVWTYDDAGNITSRQGYNYIAPTAEVTGVPTEIYIYTYGVDSWGDLLTAYDGVSRTYDEVGNLLTDGTWTYTWQNGRELASMTKGTTTWSYTYDANGMRTQRSNGTTTYNYVYNGSQLTQMTVGNDTLYFTYGILGPSTVTWNGTTYYYALNAQGDVIGIFDGNGNLVVSYNWDNAWGYNPIPEGIMASTLGALNPLRYRSYVYDQETGYYYLQSRYYDPEIGRFINADNYPATGQGLLGNNMFSYCLNNPAGCSDASGKFALSAFLGAVVGGAIGGAIISTVSHVVNCAISGQELTASGLANAAITGAVTGAIGGAIGTISLASVAATNVAKGAASVAVGIGAGVKAGLEADGSTGEKVTVGFITGVTTAGATFLGSQIDAYDINAGFGTNAFTNYATTLVVGAPAEIVSVGTQQGVNSMVNATSNSRSSFSRSTVPGYRSILMRELTY